MRSGPYSLRSCAVTAGRRNMPMPDSAQQAAVRKNSSATPSAMTSCGAWRRERPSVGSRYAARILSAPSEAGS
ncbi:MAG: hypothetical protein IJ174_08365 [Clostridia bacterium]|nr:hypothetical protein [Clostridia bacterium]